MRLFDDKIAGSVISSDGCSMVSAIDRLRFAVSGLCFIGASAHSTESFRIPDLLELFWLSFVESEVVVTSEMPDGSEVAPVMTAGYEGCLRCRSLTAVNPCAGILVSQEQPDPEVLWCSGGDLFSSSEICLIGSML